VVVARAQLAAWRVEAARRAHATADRVTAHLGAVLIVAGAVGMIGGALLVGVWLAGLTIMAEAGFAFWVGLNRDDGEHLPVRGARTVAQVLDDELLRE
jgi:hypothetical protein